MSGSKLSPCLGRGALQLPRSTVSLHPRGGAAPPVPALRPTWRSSRPASRRTASLPLRGRAAGGHSCSNVREWKVPCSSSSGEPQAHTDKEAAGDPGFYWVTAVSKAAVLKLALQQAVQACREQLPPGSGLPTVAMVFVSSRFFTSYQSVVPILKELVPSLEAVTGCSGFGVIGGAIGEGHAGAGGGQPPCLPPEEVELLSAVSVTLAALPGVKTTCFSLGPGSLPDVDSPQERWAEVVGAPLPTLPSSARAADDDREDDPKQQAEEPQDTPHFILLGDPSFAEIPDVLQGLDFAYPRSTKVGGLSSSTSMQEQWCTFCWTTKDGEPDATNAAASGVRHGGMVGLGLWGNSLSIEAIVAQGCRQVGSGTYTVTRGERMFVYEVEDEQGRTTSPLAALQATVSQLTPEDQQLAQTSIMAALAQDVLKPTSELEAGDFLIRGFQGADMNSGALAVSDRVKVGHRMRFMVRDRKGAVQDLEEHLQDFKRKELARSFAGPGTAGAPFGALLFACNGRGQGLFSEPNFDSGTFSTYIPVGVSGYFCNGEIGQVGSATHLHGFTAVFGILRANP